MAQMTTAQKNTLAADLMRELSSERKQVDITKAQLRAAIDLFDSGMETAEQSIISNVPTAARVWLINNQTVARRLLDLVAQRRTEVL